MFHRTALILAGAAWTLAGSALATPRDSFTFSNVASDSTPTVLSASVAASYSVQKITVAGTLTAPASSQSAASEAIIQAIAPSGATVTIQPFTTPLFGTVAGGAQVLTGSITVKTPNLPSAGAWRFRILDTSGNPGEDARWTSLSITLHDGPPAATDLGRLARTSTSIPAAAFHGVRWFRFTLDQSAEPGPRRFLDIATSKPGPLSPGEDPKIALFNADGDLVASNDNSPFSPHSVLSFGRHPGNIVIDPFAGQNGPLPAGTYYLALTGAGATFGPDFRVSTLSVTFGSYAAGLDTNAFTPACAADFNRDGVVDNRDLTDFTSVLLGPPCSP